MAARTNPNFMNGVPELLILRLLADGEKYGYQLVAAIRASTGQTISIGEGVVYPVLHALQQDGHLASRRVSAGGRSRFYYRLTAKGRRRLSAAVSDWKRITRGIATALGESSHAELAL
jgi:PadR family transcriptional regulator, regulatory protein PadR